MNRELAYKTLNYDNADMSFFPFCQKIKTYDDGQQKSLCRFA